MPRCSQKRRRGIVLGIQKKNGDHVISPYPFQSGDYPHWHFPKPSVGRLPSLALNGVCLRFEDSNLGFVRILVMVFVVPIRYLLEQFLFHIPFLHFNKIYLEPLSDCKIFVVVAHRRVKQTTLCRINAGILCAVERLRACPTIHFACTTCPWAEKRSCTIHCEVLWRTLIKLPSNWQ